MSWSFTPSPLPPNTHGSVWEGTCNLFMIACPDRAWRAVNVTDRRGRLDFAHRLKDLVDVHCPEAEQIRLVMDHLNTHTLAVLYEVFDAPEVRRIARKFEVHYPPPERCSPCRSDLPLTLHQPWL